MFKLNGIGRCSLLVCVLLSVKVHAESFSYSQITSDTYYERTEFADMEGNTFVWEKQVGTYYDIFYWNGSSEVRITNNDELDQAPRTSNGNVLWANYSNNKWGLNYWNGTSTTNITTGFQTVSSDYYNLSGNNAVFVGQRPGDTYSNVYKYDGSNLTRITSDQYNVYQCAVDGNNIAWYGNNRVYFYDGNSATQVHQSSFSGNLLISGNNIAWTDKASTYGQSHVYLWNGTSVSVVSSGVMYAYVRDLRLFGDKIGWTGFETSSKTDYEIYFYDGTTAKQLTNDSLLEYMGGINEYYAIWYGPKSGTSASSYEIFAYDGTKVINITDNSFMDAYPIVDGMNVLWQQRMGLSNNNMEIMFGTFSDPTVPEPTTLVLFGLGAIVGFLKRKCVSTKTVN